MKLMKGKLTLLIGSLYLAMLALVLPKGVLADTDPGANTESDLQLNAADIGFEIPSFEDFLSFLVRFLFVLAGLMALFYMLWGALSWVTSGGDKDAVGKARDKILHAVIGVLLIIATLSIIAGLETIVFKKQLCFGVTCKVTLPTLLKCWDGSEPDPDAEEPCPEPPDDESSLQDGDAQARMAQNGAIGGGSESAVAGTTTFDAQEAEADGADSQAILPVTGR